MVILSVFALLEKKERVFLKTKKNLSTHREWKGFEWIRGPDQSREAAQRAVS